MPIGMDVWFSGNPAEGDPPICGVYENDKGVITVLWNHAPDRLDKNTRNRVRNLCNSLVEDLKKYE